MGPLRISVVAVMGAVVLALGSTAIADPGGGATVLRTESGCGVPGPAAGSYAFHGVQTPSGNEQYTCRGTKLPGPAETIQYDLACIGYSGSGSATVVWTKSGQVTAKCNIDKP